MTDDESFLKKRSVVQQLLDTIKGETYSESLERKLAEALNKIGDLQREVRSLRTDRELLIVQRNALLKRK